MGDLVKDLVQMRTVNPDIVGDAAHGKRGIVIVHLDVLLGLVEMLSIGRRDPGLVGGDHSGENLIEIAGQMTFQGNAGILTVGDGIKQG